MSLSFISKWADTYTGATMISSYLRKAVFSVNSITSKRPKFSKELFLLLLLLTSMSVTVFFINCAQNIPNDEKLSSTGGLIDGYVVVPPPAGTIGVSPPAGGTSNVPLVTCNDTVFEFPLPTHWSNAVGGFVEKAVDSPVLANPFVSSTRRVYNYGFLPSIDKYIADKFDVTSIPDEEFRTWSKTICAETGVAVELRKPASFLDWSIARNKLEQSKGSIQLMHALISDDNLITLFIPPNWKQSDQRGKYPILVNGYYDLRSNLLTEGKVIAKTMGKAWKNSQVPFIGIEWNGGGGVASLTANPKARSSFNAIIQKVADNFGGDPQRIMMFGGSRGGITTLSMASNPEKYPYKIVAAYASVPMVDFSNAAKLTGSTVSQLLNIAEWSIGLTDTWKKDFRYPFAGMQGFTRAEAHLHILAGSKDPLEFENRLNISSPYMLAGLKAMGTQLYLEVGSHDVICPWMDQFRFIKKLENQGISVETRVNYLMGHAAVGIPVAPENLAQIMIRISKNDVTRIFNAGAITYFRSDISAGGLIPTAEQKFTFEYPRLHTPSIPGHIIMTGVPGTEVRFSGTFNGSPYPEQSLTLNTDGVWMTSTEGFAKGTYLVTAISIKKPGQRTWKMIDVTSGTTKMIQGNLAMEVYDYDFEASYSAGHISDLIRGAYLGANNSNAINGFTNVTYGVIEQD